MIITKQKKNDKGDSNLAVVTNISKHTKKI